MNSKILVFAEEAGLFCDGTPDSWDEDAIQRFGAKIIRECALIGFQQPMDPDDAYKVALNILDHFDLKND